MDNRRAARSTAAIIAGLAALLTAVLPAAPAWAHARVSADNPQAGAQNVTVTFVSKAESDSAGIVSERVVLAPGISPQDVRLAKAPSGWNLTPSGDGYTITGTALPVGEDAAHSIIIAQLPIDATELPFKIVDTYSNGKVNRWIEIPQPGQPKPENPAPVLKLKPAAAASPTAAAPSPSATATTSAGPADTIAATSTTDDPAGSGTWLWISATVLLAGAIVVGLAVARRARKT